MNFNGVITFCNKVWTRSVGSTDFRFLETTVSLASFKAQRSIGDGKYLRTFSSISLKQQQQRDEL